MTIFIPTPLRIFAAGQDAVDVEAANVSQALEALTQAYPDLSKHLFTPEGKLRAFVNLYLNDEDVRYLPEKEATVVCTADTLSIIPSIAGGLRSSRPARLRHMEFNLPTPN
ncbi:MAG: MoaD/ThiS family protein [Terracidiphilus sp.]|jgi:adenylyltransferase/sulfurtransferase